MDTLCDLVDSRPLKVGSGDAVYLFGGPFVLQVAADGSSGLGSLQARCVASLQGVDGTSTTHLQLALDQLSTTFAGRTPSNLAGVATVASVVEFRSDPRPAAPSGAAAPVLALDTATVHLEPDAATKARLLDAVGGDASLAALALAMIDLALTAGVRAMSARQIGMFRFLVVLGRDSESPTTLSAMPQVSWIDPQTLGVFGI